MIRKIWEWWKRVAKKIGDFNARLILTIFYFVFLMPVALPVKIIDPLGIGKKKKQGWNDKPAPEGTPMDHALRQS